MRRTLIISALLGCAVMAQAERPEVPRDTSFTTWSTNIKIKKYHPEAILMGEQLPEGVKEQRNVVYTTLKETPYGDRDLHVDIFRPDDKETYPALIMIHGGGWNSGDKSLQVPMAQQIAAKGYVTIPVEYRLIPEAKYPAGLHDIKTVVRWARSHAKEYGIDPDKIALSGCSAGAQLATLVGVTNGLQSHEGDGEWGDASSEVQAVINMDGIATFVSEHNIADARASYEKKGVLPVNAMWLGGLYEDSPANWHHASAINWTTDRSAPICFISSGLPRFSDARDHLCEVYALRGIPTVRHKIDIDIHPFWFFNPWREEALGYMVDYLDSMFKK